MIIDTNSKQSTHSEAESEGKKSGRNKRGNMGLHDYSGMQQLRSVFNHPMYKERSANYHTFPKYTIIVWALFIHTMIEYTSELLHATTIMEATKSK